MSKFPLNKTFQLQQKTLVKATHKRATISSVNVGSRTANVYFSENPQTVIKNIPFASGINVSAVSAGMQCRVDLYDETNPNNMVIAYVVGQVSSQVTALIPASVPANSSSVGSAGQVSWDSNYYYICIANNTWRRIAHSSF